MWEYNKLGGLSVMVPGLCGHQMNMFRSSVTLSSNIPYFMFLRFREKAKVSSLKIQCYARVGRIQSTIDLSLDGDGHWIEL